MFKISKYFNVSKNIFGIKYSAENTKTLTKFKIDLSLVGHYQAIGNLNLVIVDTMDSLPDISH